MADSSRSAHPATERVPAGHRDAELARRLAAGDQAALASVYDRYGGPAYSLARRVCASEEVAQDVVQETFLSLWREPGRFDPERGSFCTWLMTLVHRRAVNAVRSQHAHRRRSGQAADPREPPEAETEVGALAGVQGDRVRAAIAELPERHRTVIGLAYFGGYTRAEVATLTGLPLETVQSRTVAALRRLRAALAAQHQHPGGHR